MELTKKEIFSQYEALRKTYEYFNKKKDEIKSFFEKHTYESITFIGSGSSYCLCQSAEISTKVQTGIPANSIAAGDLMLNFSHYEKIIKNTLLVTPSRSGSTSEVVLAVKEAKSKFNIPIIAISTKIDTKLNGIADLNLSIPWAFDESVCQTRTVTNLYMLQLLLIAVLGDQNSIFNEVEKVINYGSEYINNNKNKLRKIGNNKKWDKVIVLADSELEGIASEGALAFKEITRIPANYHHLLDVRHGPMVLIDDKTLIIMANSPEGITYQQDLIKDIKEKEAIIITVGTDDEENNVYSDLHINIPKVDNYGVRGIPFIFIPQVISYYRAKAEGIDPDLPEGLDPWISLDTAK